MALGKIKLCRYFCDITCRAFCSSSKLLNCSTLCHKLEIIIGKVKTARAIFKSCKTALWKFSKWIYRRLRIISRTRSRATQESSKEIYHRFHFVNSSETFQHLCGFQDIHGENGQNIFTWTTLCLQRIIFEIHPGSLTNAKENLSSQKLASSAPFHFLTSFWPEVSWKYNI